MGVGAIVAIVDTADTLGTGFEGPAAALAWYTSSSLVFGIGLLGALLAAYSHLCLILCRKLNGGRGEALRAFLLGLPGGGFMAWVPSSWITEHWAGLDASGRAIALAVTPFALLASTAIAWGVRTSLARYRRHDPELLPRHGLHLAVAVALATAAYWMDRRVLVGLYEDFHYGLTGLFVSSTALVSWLGVRTLRHHHPELVARAAQAAINTKLVLAASLSAALSLGALELLSPQVFGPSNSVVFGKLASTVRTWSDFDGDGPSHLFGGSDCEPFNPKIRPGKFDMPGNALDEDCSGTAAEWPKPEPPQTHPVPDAAGYNVLLITIDALRADHVGAWGYKRHPTTPNIDALARRSLRFAEAFAPAPKTYDTLPSLITGLYPSNVGRDYRGVEVPKGGTKKPYLYQISKETSLFTEIIAQNGYATGASHGVSILRTMRLDRGFEEYRANQRQAEFALDFIDRRVVHAEKPQPFFMWLHFYSPHHPYDKRDGFDFGDSDIDRYDSEIAFDDREVGVILDKLDNEGLSDRTIIVLTADHGEEFRDHGGTTHGFTLYRELTHVPLLIAIPAVEAQVVDDPVELADVVPTLCELLQLQTECVEHDGHSLLAAAAGKRSADRGAYSEMYRKNDVLLLNAINTGKWRLIYDYKKDRAELYDVMADRSEQRDLASRHPKLVQQLRDVLAVRPLFRQGRVFQNYEKTRDSVALAEQLPILRRVRLLKRALRRIEGDLRPAHVPHLKKLLKRPGLSKPLRDTTLELISRAGGGKTKTPKAKKSTAKRGKDEITAAKARASKAARSESTQSE
jgi:arylsulfatase A-like enzyme